MNVLNLDTVDSTNSWVKKNSGILSSPTLVVGRNQTHGRGQKGNSWESEPGKNITASLFFNPKVFEARNQFAISEAISLSIVDTLKELGVEAYVKWPNDIYVNDDKICGILVEHVVAGRYIQQTIAGFGLNINQTVFLSDAPNPVSLKILTSKEYQLDEICEFISSNLEKALADLEASGLLDIHSRFLEKVWRKDGKEYPFFDRIKKEKIKASITDITPDGMLILHTDGGEKRSYAFKEVEFILERGHI